MISIPHPQDNTNFVDSKECPIELFSGMTSTYTKPGSIGQNGDSREANDNDSKTSFEAFSGKSSDFSGVVEHDGYDGRVIVSQDMEAHVIESHAEVVGVVAEGFEFSTSDVGVVLACNDFESGDELLTDDGAEGVVVDGSSALDFNVINDLFGCGNVATHSTEALGESAHEYMYIGGVYACILAAASASGTAGSNGVCLVEVKINVVFFAKLGYGFEIAVLALHGINAFDKDDDLVLRPAGPGPAEDNGVLDELLKM